MALYIHEWAISFLCVKSMYHTLFLAAIYVFQLIVILNIPKM